MSDNTVPRITVEVAYALPQLQRIVTLEVPSGTTALQAVQASGVLESLSLSSPAGVQMGIFSRLLDGKSAPLPQDCTLQHGDRVEIYRPLQLDPKQVRLLRAARAKKSRAAQANGH